MSDAGMAGKRAGSWRLPGWMHRLRREREKRAAVRRRDGDLCWRCNRPMRFGPPFNRGKAATIEHVRPLSKGGNSAIGNLRLCHVGCNRHLGAKLPDEKERMRINVRAPASSC